MHAPFSSGGPPIIIIYAGIDAGASSNDDGRAGT